MTILTRKDLYEMEENYYWAGYRKWYPFPKELREKILEVYGEEPYPYIWSEQDVFEGSRKIIIKFFDV